MTAVKCWRQSDLIMSHLPLCPGLHIVLKYGLYNQLDRKPNKKHKTRKRKKKKKTTNTHSRQTLVENEKQTSPFHSMALPSWSGMVRCLNIWKFVYQNVSILYVCTSYTCLYVSLLDQLEPGQGWWRCAPGRRCPTRPASPPPRGTSACKTYFCFLTEI